MSNVQPSQYKNKLQRELTNSLNGLRKIAKSNSLTSDIGSGAALIPLPLQKEIVNGIIAHVPFLKNMNIKSAGAMNMTSNRHTYTKLKRLRRPGSYAAETTIPEPQSASTEQAFINHKVRKNRMRVWRFLQAVTAGQVDALAFELDNASRAAAYDMEFSLMFDNPTLQSTATNTFGAFEHSFDSQIQTNRISKYVNGLPVAISEQILDEMISAAILGGANPATSRIYMSPDMANRLSRVVTPGTMTYFRNVDGTQPFQVDAGMFINTYKGFKIETTTFLGGRTAGEGNVAYAISNIPGGDFTADTWYFKIEKVQIDANNNVAEVAYGRSKATETALDQVLSGTEGVRITIPTGDPTALQYRIYATNTTDTLANYKLVAVVRGQTYNAEGQLTGSITNTNATSGLTVTSDANGNVIQIDLLHANDTFYPVSEGIMLDQGIVGKMKHDQPLTEAGGLKAETVMLIDHSEFRGMGDFIYLTESADVDNGFMIVEQITPLADYADFFFRLYGTPLFSFDGSSTMMQGLRAE